MTQDVSAERTIAPAGRGPRVAVRPLPAPDWAQSAVLSAGAQLVDIEDAEALFWMDPRDPAGLFDLLADSPQVQWVHLRWAGITAFARVGSFDDGRTWTCGKGVFADAVAEHALALGLAGLRDLPLRVAARSWGPESGSSLMDGHVTVLGGGGIAASLSRLLAPMRVSLTVVRRTPTPFEGAIRTLTPDRLDEALPGADLVVLALALTLETTGIIGARQLRLMEPHAWLVNVARGGHVVTDDLVSALRERRIGGAALDVTEPEPLPDDHPLWGIDRCLITPHTASTTEMTIPAMQQRIAENILRYSEGRPLIGPIDPVAGY
jgi:phosphoglycerate dehydrogenase-like enzyme